MSAWGEALGGWGGRRLLIHIHPPTPVTRLPRREAQGATAMGSRPRRLCVREAEGSTPSQALGPTL